jgi:t-SNARE complex subunit (syntaxin)
MMADLNMVQEDTKVELQKQRENLIKVEDKVADAKENVDKAQDEIVKAEKHQKSTGKCIKWIVFFTIILAAIIVLIVYFSGKN